MFDGEDFLAASAATVVILSTVTAALVAKKHNCRFCVRRTLGEKGI